MNEVHHVGNADWDIVADGAEADKDRPTGRSSGQNLDGVPALVYTAFSQQKIDGRFHKATEGVSTSILFDLPDFRPAALMMIDNGDYEIIPVADPEKLAEPPDALVQCCMVDAVKMLGGLGPILKTLFTGKIKLKGFRKLWLLVKVLMTKEAS